MKVVDTVSIGDRFQAALFFRLRVIERIAAGSLAQMKSAEFRRLLTFAPISAAIAGASEIT